MTVALSDMRFKYFHLAVRVVLLQCRRSISCRVCSV